jgi:hypothetical protein
MSLPVENVAAQGQPPDLRYVDMGYYDMPNDRPPTHEHRDYGINNYAGVALDIPPQAQAPPAAVCSDLFLLHTHI